MGDAAHAVGLGAVHRADHIQADDTDEVAADAQAP